MASAIFRCFLCSGWVVRSAFSFFFLIGRVDALLLTPCRSHWERGIAHAYGGFLANDLCR